MKSSVARRIALTLTALVMVCGGWLLLAPTAVGGPMTLVVSSGVSMQPTFHTGDLAILRSTPTYHVGDVVGYHSRTLHNAVVMHRLIGGNSSQWTTKGDHNNWLDPDHPTNADIVGKLWLHVPRGGLLLTRVMLPLAFVAFLGLLLPFRTRGGTDEDGEPVRSTGGKRRRTAPIGKHVGRPRAALPIIGRVPDWLSRETCARVVAGGLALAIAGALVAIMGYGHAPYRMTTSPQAHPATVTFGWSGTSPATWIYPTGRLTDPEPIFSKVVDRITITADITDSPGANRPSNSPTLIGSLSDDSGWTHQWAIVTTGEQLGGTTRLSGTLDVKNLLMQVAWAQNTVGVSGPATLKVAVGDKGGTTASGPSLSFALSNVALKPQGPLTVTSAATTRRTMVPATLTVSGHKVRISQLRYVGTVAVAVGLLVALGAALLSRRLPEQSAQDRLLRLFAGRVVHLSDAGHWDNACLDVTEAESLAAFAETPGAVLYVVESAQRSMLIAERGQTRLRYVPASRPTQPPVAMEAELAAAEIPQQRVPAALDQRPAEWETVEQ